MADTPGIRLEPWSEDSLGLLRRINTPQMRAHVGGPETEEQLLVRHRRYLGMPAAGKGVMYAVLLDGAEAGSICYHARPWEGRTVFETGWNVLPEFQGRGVAVAAGRLLVAAARADGRHPHLHAFPSVDNGPSNALCRRLGFELLGETDFEYPAGSGHHMRSNNWRLTLA